MDQKNNKKKKPDGGKNNGNLRGVVSLVCWALMLTIIFSYASSYMTSKICALSSAFFRSNIVLLRITSTWKSI